MRAFTEQEAKLLLNMIYLADYSKDSQVQLILHHVNHEKESSYIQGKTDALVEFIQDQKKVTHNSIQ